MPDWFWYVVSAAVAIGYVVSYFRNRRREANAIAAAARERSWDFRSTDRSYVHRYSGRLFTNSGHRARNVVVGLHRGRDFAAYEFSYRVGMDFKYADAGLLRNRCRYQVVSVSHGLDGVPVVDIDSSGGSLTELVTSLFDRFDPAGSETAEMLSAKVTRRLKGDHGDFVREPDSWLESQPLAASHPLRFENGDVVTWRSGALDLDEVAELLDYLNDVVERLPEVRSGS